MEVSTRLDKWALRISDLLNSCDERGSALVISVDANEMINADEKLSKSTDETARNLTSTSQFPCPDTKTIAFNKVKQLLRLSQSGVVRIPGYRSSGEEIESVIAVEPVLDPKGNTIHLIAVAKTCESKRNQLSSAPH